jgi:hypothetical protein
MLVTTIRWGVPLVLLFFLVAATNNSSRDPAVLARHVLDTATSVMSGLFGRLF